MKEMLRKKSWNWCLCVFIVSKRCLGTEKNEKLLSKDFSEADFYLELIHTVIRLKLTWLLEVTEFHFPFSVLSLWSEYHYFFFVAFLIVSCSPTHLFIFKVCIFSSSWIRNPKTKTFQSLCWTSLMLTELNLKICTGIVKRIATLISRYISCCIHKHFQQLLIFLSVTMTQIIINTQTLPPHIILGHYFVCTKIITCCSHQCCAHVVQKQSVCGEYGADVMHQKQKKGR